MRRDLPHVAPGILNRGAAIAPRHVGGFLNSNSTGRDGLSICLVSIFDVDVEKSRPCLAYTAAVGDHDQRIANPYLRWGARSELTVGGEDRFHEADDAGNVACKYPWDDRRPPTRLELGHNRLIRDTRF
jgi:hypothetical protein